MKRLAILASGSGTNAENIIQYFKNHQKIEVVEVLSNNKNAKVLERAARLNIPFRIFNRHSFLHTDEVLNHLKQQADFLILAGFLWKIPENIVQAFPNRILNIHPALLPKYGGKGMYGSYVHEAVVANKEKESGISIHFVNEHYDEGAIVFQKSVALSPEDGPEEVAQKIHVLEYENFPKVIEKVLLDS